MLGNRITITKIFESVFKNRLEYGIKNALITVLASILLAGLIFINENTVERFIIAFGLISIIVGLISIVQFYLALICFVSIIPIYSIGKYNLANAFAIYAFYFLLFGAINILLESQLVRSPKINYGDFEPIAKIKRQPTIAPPKIAPVTAIKPLQPPYQPIKSPYHKELSTRPRQSRANIRDIQ